MTGCTHSRSLVAFRSLLTRKAAIEPLKEAAAQAGEDGDVGIVNLSSMSGEVRPNHTCRRMRLSVGSIELAV